MTILLCPIPGCGFNTDNVDVIVVAAILDIHANIHSTPPAAHPVHRAHQNLNDLRSAFMRQLSIGTLSRDVGKSTE